MILRDKLFDELTIILERLDSLKLKDAKRGLELATLLDFDAENLEGWERKIRLCLLDLKENARFKRKCKDLK